MQAPPAGYPSSQAALAPAGSGSEIRFETLRSLIRTRGVRSIDELLPLLPESFRSQYVLMYESRSLQEASYRSPRALLYANDARFVAAFNGDPGESGHRSLETMEFDEAQRAFRFREIVFPDESAEGAGAVFSEVNPRKCLECHGESPRPLWDTYPTWPGAYGEHDQGRPEAEAAGLAEFLAGRPYNPRYRLLVGSESLATRPLSADVAAYEGRDRLSRNSDFGLKLQRLEYRRIAREVMTSPKFAPFRYALLASLEAQCLDIEDFLPDAVRAGFARRARDFERETERANAEESTRKRLRTHGPSDEVVHAQTETLAPFRYLVEEGLGIPTHGWTLALEESTYDFTTPRRSTWVLERDILDEVARTDPQVRVLRGDPGHRDDYCATLRKRSNTALADGLKRARNQAQR
jgi:hypothetical protein